jgi:ribosomal protein S21
VAVIVNPSETIDSALKRLHREVLREKILELYREKQYHVKKSLKQTIKKMAWAKTKRRRRSASRRAK